MLKLRKKCVIVKEIARGGKMKATFKYENQTDEEIIKSIQQGDNNALNFLLEKYKNRVKLIANRFFMYGSDQNDVLQEGMIGLYLAIKKYDDSFHASFKSFATMCIERQLITAVKNANRQKHFPLNNAISINNSYDEEDNRLELQDKIELKDSVKDPLETIADDEYYKLLNNAIQEALSTKELEVLNEYKQGKSYLEIAETLHCKTKSVDTALTRIRRKANKIKQKFNEEEM